MNKAVLIMDMPNCCADCDLANVYTDGLFCVQAINYLNDIDSSKEKPDWCPLRQLPQRMEVCGRYPQPDGKMPSYKIGWNDCLEAIEGEHKMIKEYCYSWDGERYFGEFDTAKEALKEAKREKPDAKSVFIGTCTEPELKWRSFAEDLIGSMAENLSDDVGEAAEQFEVSPENEIELDKLLDKAIKTWITERNIVPSCYKVLDGHKVDLQKSMTTIFR